MISRRRATLPIMTRSFLTSSLSCSGTIFELVLSVTFQLQREGRGGEGEGERER